MFERKKGQANLFHEKDRQNNSTLAVDCWTNDSMKSPSRVIALEDNARGEIPKNMPVLSR